MSALQYKVIMGGGFIVAMLAMIKATNTKRVMLSNLTNFIYGFFEIAVVYCQFS